MKNSFSLLFYIKKSKADAAGRANIYLRITVNGKRAELSIQRKILIENWNAQTSMARGNSPESQEINRHITTIKNRMYTKNNAWSPRKNHLPLQCYEIYI